MNNLFGEGEPPDNKIAGIAAILAIIGSGIAGTWLWLTKIRNKENKRVFRSYRSLFYEAKERIETLEKVNEELRDKLSEARITNAKHEEHIAYQDVMLNTRKRSQST